MSGKRGQSGKFPDVTQLRDDIDVTEAPTLSAASTPGTSRGDYKPPPNQLLAEIGRFADKGEIGVGGMGEVRAVYDEILLRRVAIKSLHNDLARSEEHTQRFLEEVQITSQLDHPHIVPVHDVGFHPRGNAFFVMKLIKGKTLSRIIASQYGKPLGGRRLEEWLLTFIKVCDAIDFAHSRNVIHRDLKPSNIMVGDHGEVYVMDWGIALLADGPRRDALHDPPQLGRSAESHRESAGSLMGTAAYMAPEQARAKADEIDFRTDVFGLGGILYEMMTGQPPYPGESASIQLNLARLGDIRHPQEVVKDRRLPPRLCRIALKAMAKNKDDRYQTARELKQEIQAFLRGGGWFETMQFNPGSIIVREGDDPELAYIIEEGHCEVYKNEGKDRQVLRTMGPGDVFGETALFTGKARTATVRAIDRVRVQAITYDRFNYEVAEKGWLGTFVRALAERFREHDKQLSELLEKTRE